MKREIRVSLLAGLLMLASVSRGWAAGSTTITWHGHAAFEIVTPGGKVLMLDPWLKNPVNPDGKEGKDPVAAVKKADYILITHAHADHVGDAVALAKATGAKLIANSELAGNMVKLLGFPKEQAGFDTIMGIGGEIKIADGEVTVAMVPAVHSSGLGDPNAGAQGAAVVYGGNPAGFVLVIKNGPTIYHTGATAYFKDMELIGEKYAPDVALINIGGHFGMEPPMAARAASAVGAKLAIPQHYGTFPVLNGETKGFTEALTKKKIPFLVMQPGSSISFEGKKLKK